MSTQSELISADWVLPMDGDPIRHGGIVIAGGRIAAVGHRSELHADRTSVYEEAIVLPGFVNAHTHLEYASFAGFGDGFDFGPWIDLHMSRKRHLGRDDLLASARLGAACCLASGITTVAWPNRRSQGAELVRRVHESEHVDDPGADQLPALQVLQFVEPLGE